MGWAAFWVIIFENSSGHPDAKTFCSERYLLLQLSRNIARGEFNDF
jgi:hypothetical protein